MQDNIQSDNIIISSRIRLARNLKNRMFTTKVTQEQAYQIIDDVYNAIISDKNTSSMGFKLFYLNDMAEIEQNMFVEQHVISPQLVKNKNIAAVLLNKNEKTSIMVNEEDHIRIQVLCDRLCLDECLQIANIIDDALEERLDFAFDKELGYITACPTNLGTGLRASTMLHLPALAMTNQIDRILLAISQIGVAVRGVYGEGTRSMGNLYQISNQSTLGASEEALIERIRQITTQLIDKEKNTRLQLLTNSRLYVEDEIFRAYGILKNARLIQVPEAMRLLSIIKMGIEMGILDNMSSKGIIELMEAIQENNIQITLSGGLTKNDRSIKRAELLRNKIL